MDAAQWFGPFLRCTLAVRWSRLFLRVFDSAKAQASWLTGLHQLSEDDKSLRGTEYCAANVIEMLTALSVRCKGTRTNHGVSLSTFGPHTGPPEGIRAASRTF